MIILAVESSCDETAIAIVRNGRQVLANEIASQIDIHALYGGVVPEIASRMHVEALSPLYRNALKNADIGPQDIDAVAVTNAPMLAGAMTAVMPHDATNYVFFVECDWSPTPTVVTNGVYHVRAVENGEKVVPIGVNIRLPEQQENPQ